MAPEKVTCEAWTDHSWSDRRFLESGRHPTMGRFNRYTVECEHCGKRTTETEWLNLNASPYGTTIGTTAEPRRD